jgi:hypothetical protein
MTTIYEVGIGADVDDGFKVVYKPSVLRFKNQGDANEYLLMLNKLQQRDIMPKTYKDVPISPYLMETAFYTLNELDQVQLKRKYILSKLDDDERVALGLQ